MKPPTASPTTIDATARLFKAFSDPVRLRLLNLLVGGEVCVCHLHGALGLPQPTVSRHLASLRKAGLVVGRKEGLWVHYRLAEATGDLHRALLATIDPTLADLATFRADRDRLVGLTHC